MATIDAKAEQYRQQFGAYPPFVSGMTDDQLEKLIDRALERGSPITGDELEEHLPPDAVA